MLCNVLILPANLNPASPSLPVLVPLIALLDTGATSTAIVDSVARQLALRPAGKIRIQGVGGVQLHNSYLFRVGFCFPFPTATPVPANLPPATPMQTDVQSHFLDKIIQGAGIMGGPTNFQVLLGMDVLSTGCLNVWGNGQFSFSF